jgi:hypothetical protein
MNFNILGFLNKIKLKNDAFMLNWIFGNQFMPNFTHLSSLVTDLMRFNIEIQPNPP